MCVDMWVLVLGFFAFILAVSRRFSLVSDHRGRLKVGSACREFEDNEGGIFG